MCMSVYVCEMDLCVRKTEFEGKKGWKGSWVCSDYKSGFGRSIATATAVAEINRASSFLRSPTSTRNICIPSQYVLISHARKSFPFLPFVSHPLSRWLMSDSLSLAAPEHHFAFVPRHGAREQTQTDPDEKAAIEWRLKVSRPSTQP